MLQPMGCRCLLISITCSAAQLLSAANASAGVEFQHLTAEVALFDRL